MQYPRITVVTACLNMVAYIEATIESVINQEYPNLEYIIVDGGSRDGTVDVINKYLGHLAFFVSEADDGMYHAIQKGFVHSSGDIMCWVNGDDVLCPGSLYLVASVFMKYPECRWLQGLNSIMGESGYIREIVVPYNVSKYAFLANLHLEKCRWLRKFGTIQQESTFWRRTLWDDAGGALNLCYKLAGDFELWMRFFRHDRLYLCSTSLGVFRVRENQKSAVMASLYVVECNNICANEKKMLSRSDIFKLFLIRLLTVFPLIKLIPYFKTFYKFYMTAPVLPVPDPLEFENSIKSQGG